jgi:hypothetical protein
VIVHGEKARSEFRHKTFSFLKETTNVFIPEGSFIDYVLESYERGYLSLLLAASYANVEKPDEAKVELRQLDHELLPLYNYGEDPVNLCYQLCYGSEGKVNEAALIGPPERSGRDVERPADAVRLCSAEIGLMKDQVSASSGGSMASVDFLRSRGTCDSLGPRTDIFP